MKFGQSASRFLGHLPYVSDAVSDSISTLYYIYRPAQTDVKSSVVAALRLSGIEVILVSNRVADGKSG